ncbi:hypothetical protein GOODEAATRI_005626 [Goodea atripinnis]|uniref:Uncharacterized protein n=1 Tax=Goodea atripinnis TaxID=208336 RepID=A0ABV0NT82_9TELE
MTQHSASIAAASNWGFSESIALPCALLCPLDVDIAPCASPGATMSNPTHDPFYSSPFGPFYRRHSPYMVQPEFRIYEMNKRLQARTEVSPPDVAVTRKRDPGRELGRSTRRRKGRVGVGQREKL